MKITNIKINGIINPVGFAYDSIRCSWLVRETRAKKSIYSKIEVSTDEDFKSIIYVKKGKPFPGSLHRANEGQIDRTVQPARNGKRGHCREGNHPYPGWGNGT